MRKRPYIVQKTPAEYAVFATETAAVKYAVARTEKTGLPFQVIQVIALTSARHRSPKDA